MMKYYWHHTPKPKTQWQKDLPQPELAEDNEDPVYVITKGKEKEDAGIYTNWGEVSPKSPVCLELTREVRQPGRGQIPPGASWVQPSPDWPLHIQGPRPQEPTQQQGSWENARNHDYRALHGGNSKQQPTAINASPNNPPDEGKMKGEITRMKIVIESMKKKAEKDEQYTKDQEENTTLTH